MTGLRFIRLGGILCAGAALASCTSVSPGTPMPIESTAAPTSQTAPTRPREITLDGVDPCTLLPQDEFGTYDITDPGKPLKMDQGFDSCMWYTRPGYFNASLVTSEGVEAQEGRYGIMEPTRAINGFPAYTLRLPDDEMSCFILVDVAEGQYLDIQAGLTTVPDDIPPLCEYAHQFTESIMESLVRS